MFPIRSPFSFALLAFLLLSGCDAGGDPPAGGKAAQPFAVVFHLDGEMPPFTNPQNMFAALSMSQYRLTSLLEKASADPGVQEVVVHLGSPAVSMGRAQELVEALRQVTARGKPLVCHIDSVDNVGYWIAAQACPRILVSPAGGVEALGLSLEAIYIRDLLSSFGVVADIIHIGEYKDAAEPLTRQEMSEHAREAAEGVLFELHRLLLEGIAKGRKMDSARVQAVLDGGPYNAKQTVALGLADEERTLQSTLDALEDKYPGGVNDEYGKPPPKRLSFGDLMKMFGQADAARSTPGPKIALVPMIGAIMGGESNDIIGGGETIREMEVTRALSDLARDDDIRGVVIRIDSPGGSALASDNIWHSVRALAARKPVVVSMGDVAASGGYYIASGATEVIAEPGTLTGSIGVVGGKLVFAEAAEKIGVNSQRIQTGKRAGLTSPFREFSGEERAAIEALMKNHYDLFIDRIVEGRGLDRERVLSAAKGRVWTGSQALQIGLVNQLGGLSTAIARAQALASLPATAPVEIRPKPKSFMEVLGEALNDPGAAAVTRSLARRHATLGHGLALASLLLEEKVLAFLPALYTIR